jgi:hypothetical protein
VAKGAVRAVATANKEADLHRVGIGGAGGWAEEHLGRVGAVVQVPAAIGAASGGVEDSGQNGRGSAGDAADRDGREVDLVLFGTVPDSVCDGTRAQ